MVLESTDGTAAGSVSADWSGERTRSSGVKGSEDLKHTEAALQVFTRPHQSFAVFHQAPPLTTVGQLRSVARQLPSSTP